MAIQAGPADALLMGIDLSWLKGTRGPGAGSVLVGNP